MAAYFNMWNTTLGFEILNDESSKYLHIKRLTQRASEDDCNDNGDM